MDLALARRHFGLSRGPPPGWREWVRSLEAAGQAALRADARSKPGGPAHTSCVEPQAVPADSCEQQGVGTMLETVPRGTVGCAPAGVPQGRGRQSSAGSLYGRAGADCGPGAEDLHGPDRYGQGGDPVAAPTLPHTISPKGHALPGQWGWVDRGGSFGLNGTDRPQSGRGFGPTVRGTFHSGGGTPCPSRYGPQGGHSFLYGAGSGILEGATSRGQEEPFQGGGHSNTHKQTGFDRFVPPGQGDLDWRGVRMDSRIALWYAHPNACVATGGEKNVGGSGGGLPTQDSCRPLFQSTADGHSSFGPELCAPHAMAVQTDAPSVSDSPCMTPISDSQNPPGSACGTERCISPHPVGVTGSDVCYLEHAVEGLSMREHTGNATHPFASPAKAMPITGSMPPPRC